MAQVTRLGLYGGPRAPYAGFAPAPATAAVTRADLTEAEVVVGGEGIVVVLTNDTFVAAGIDFNSIRDQIVAGLDSAQSEVTGWNAEVRDKAAPGIVVRASDVAILITLPATAAYDITANETITVTLPAAALVTSSSEVIATPTFDVIADAQEGPSTSAGTGRSRVYPYPRTPTSTSRRKKAVKADFKAELELVETESKAEMGSELGGISDSPPDSPEAPKTALGETLQNLANFPERSRELTPEGLRALIAGVVSEEVERKVAEALENVEKEAAALKILAVLKAELEEGAVLAPGVEELLLLLLLV